MAVTLIGNAGVVADVDEARNIQVFEGIAGFPAAGGFYTVAGKSGTAAIAAALATDTPLASIRFSPTSTRKAYVNKFRIQMTTATSGAAGGVPSVLGIQKFTTATPTGGTARTPIRLGPTKGSATDMTDVRDNNAALTVTSVVFTDEIAWTLTPTGSTFVGQVEWIFEPITPLELAAGDGLMVRTRQAGPATATWYFSYTWHWFER
jgi:hypothetical protein